MVLQLSVLICNFGLPCHGKTELKQGCRSLSSFQCWLRQKNRGFKENGSVYKTEWRCVYENRDLSGQL